MLGARLTWGSKVTVATPLKTFLIRVPKSSPVWFSIASGRINFAFASDWAVAVLPWLQVSAEATDLSWDFPRSAQTEAGASIADTAKAKEYDFSDLQYDDEQIHYQAAKSMLTIPLKNSQDEVLGVMQLLDPQDSADSHIIPFDDNLQQMMESFSSLAVAALEAYIREQGLKQEILQLRIEIDETKRKQEVSEIVDTDFFSDLQARAQEIRRRHRPKSDKSKDSGSDS